MDCAMISYCIGSLLFTIYITHLQLCELNESTVKEMENRKKKKYGKTSQTDITLKPKMH